MQAKHSILKEAKLVAGEAPWLLRWTQPHWKGTHRQISYLLSFPRKADDTVVFQYVELLDPVCEAVGYGIVVLLGM